MSEYQIECVSLSKFFGGRDKLVMAVEDVNLRIRTNDTVIIKGRSGAGKSTLLNLMCGLIKPTSGKVIIENDCINEMPNDVLSKLLLNRIGIIFQSFNLLPTYTVFENIELALVPRGREYLLAKETIMAMLEQFNLKEKAHLFPPELSIGQQQKAAVIRTLIKQPSIIFADEPTGSVDEETAMEIIEHLTGIKRENPVTLVIATHGNIPENFADNVYTIENGRIIGS